MALNEFEGTVMLVSHDRALLRAVCDEFWLVSRGGVVPFDGDLDDYQQFLLDEAKRVRESIKEAQKEAKAAVTPPPANIAKKLAANLKSLQRDQGKLEQKMLEAQGAKNELEARLLSLSSPQEIGEVGLKIQALDEELSELEERWLTLSEEIETIYA